jgi:hypothetical protein
MFLYAKKWPNELMSKVSLLETEHASNENVLLHMLEKIVMSNCNRILTSKQQWKTTYFWPL